MNKTLIALIVFTFAVAASAEDNCKTLKACSDWATNRTGAKYDLGKLEKRGLKVDKDFSLNDGDADFLFNYIIQNNDLIRLKRDNGSFQIINAREMKDFQFPTLKAEEIPSTLDYYTVDFALANKERVANARIILKKLLGKNGRMLEVADAPKIQVVDTGFQLLAVRSVITELNK